MTSFRRDHTGRGSKKAAAVLELAILVVLLVFLGVAAGKLFVLLVRLGVPLWKGLPIGLLFVAAAAVTARRVSVRARGLRRRMDDESA